MRRPAVPPYIDRDPWAVRTSSSGLRDGQGCVATVHGYVHVLAWPKGFAKLPSGRTYFGPVTRLSFIRRGRSYGRTHTRVLTRRGTAQAAARFAADVVAGRVR